MPLSPSSLKFDMSLIERLLPCGTEWISVGEVGTEKGACGGDILVSLFKVLEAHQFSTPKGDGSVEELVVQNLG